MNPTASQPPGDLPPPNPWPLREIALDSIRPRVGVRAVTLTRTYAFRGPTHPFGLILYWARPVSLTVDPRVPPFLRVKAWHGPPHTPADKQEEFGDRSTLEGLAAQFNRVPLPQGPDRRASYEYQAARLSGLADITLQITIDTEDDYFNRQALTHVRERSDQPFTLELNAYLFDAQHRDARFEQIRLILGGATLPSWDEGLVGIDLGHHASSLAWLPPLGETTSAIRMLDARGRPAKENREPEGSILGVLDRSASAVASNLQVTHITTDQRQQHRLNWCRWAVGVTPGGPTAADNLFFSVKRQLAERDPGTASPRSTRRVVVYPSLYAMGNDPRVEYPLPSRLPPELFFCRLFQRAREATCHSVRCFAITYPTTFSVREVAQARAAAYRGWLRSLDQPQPEPYLDLEAEEVRRRFPLALDEASAAGYFLLHRIAFEQPHGLARFRYLYPNGLDLLLFDCGGGTIDIGLLRATYLHAEPSHDRPPGLGIEVVGRSGKRSFGGDNITEAVFRLLKAQLALVLLHSVGEKLELPKQPEQLARFLDDHADRLDAAFPTRFTPDGPPDTVTDRRRAVTQNLWMEADRLKCALASESAVRYRHTRQSPLDEYLRRLVRSGSQPIDSRLNAIEIRREQIDALVGGEILDSIERCNHLIHERLTSKGREVNCVAMIGNGARYPMFLEQMRSRLAVPFLDERLLKIKESDSEGPFEIDQVDLKNAVAKGAVLALNSQQQVQNIRVQFDQELSERIPFTLAYRDMKQNQFLVLLREHDRYDQLSNSSRELDAARRPGSESEVLLYRHWPGDLDARGNQRFWPYLVYRFHEPIRSGITVRFDHDTHSFVVASGLDEAELVMELIEDVEENRLWRILSSANPQQELRRIFQAPIQRGEL